MSWIVWTIVVGAAFGLGVVIGMMADMEHFIPGRRRQNRNDGYGV